MPKYFERLCPDEKECNRQAWLSELFPSPLPQKMFKMKNRIFKDLKKKFSVKIYHSLEVDVHDKAFSLKPRRFENGLPKRKFLARHIIWLIEICPPAKSLHPPHLQNCNQKIRTQNRTKRSIAMTCSCR